VAIAFGFLAQVVAFGLGAAGAALAVQGSSLALQVAALIELLATVTFFSSLLVAIVAAAWDYLHQKHLLLQRVDAAMELAAAGALDNARAEHQARHDAWEALASPSGAAEEVAEAVEAALDGVSWPFDVACQVSVPTRDHVLLLVDLPELEDITHEGAKLRDRQAVYARNVCSIAIMVATCAFSAARCIQEVTVAAYTQRRARDGTLRDDFVLELPTRRGEMKALDGSEDPVGFVTSAKVGRIKLTKTQKLSRISVPKWAGDV
jgi:hypothetical protein